MAPHRRLCFNLQFSWVFDMIFGSLDCDRIPLQILRHVCIRFYETWRKWAGCISSNFTPMCRLMTSFAIGETMVSIVYQCTIKSFIDWNRESQCFAHLKVTQNASFVIFNWIRWSIAFCIFCLSTPNIFTRPL
jgi:hypothetical protein